MFWTLELSNLVLNLGFCLYTCVLTLGKVSGPSVPIQDIGHRKEWKNTATFVGNNERKVIVFALLQQEQVVV